MIENILSKIDKVSMSTGRFFSDKSYKYDTVFFTAKYIYDLVIERKEIELTQQIFDSLVNRFVEVFSLPKNQKESNKNYLMEGLGFLVFSKVLDNPEGKKYVLINQDILEFITVSIENAYIFQYLVAYKTFRNDGIWNLYIDYLKNGTTRDREEKLFKIKLIIDSKAQSVNKTDSVWAYNYTKFPIMILGLANNDFAVTRTLNITDKKITAESLTANVEGTKSSTVKNNFYIHDFRTNYVKEMLKNYLADEEYSSMDYDNCERIKGGENVILYGVPGAGKSWTIKNEYCSDDTLIERLVFHPDYTYSDFVGQILPKLDENSNVSYVFTPGPFTNILRKSYLNPNKKFYLVIEEINRGNAPAIFGDIFQLLDRQSDYILNKETNQMEKNPLFGASEYTVTNVDIAKSVYGDESHKISIPSNMFIIGTMNTSDQNVFTLDTAFQRRWSMRLIHNEFLDDENEKDFAETKILDTTVSWKTFFTEINNMIISKNIKMTSSEDKRLGTHFVCREDLLKDDYTGTDEKLIIKANRQNRKFAEKVLKYLWDDAFKFNKDEVFDIKLVNSLEKVITEFTDAKGNDRFRKILKSNIFDSLVPPEKYNE